MDVRVIAVVLWRALCGVAGQLPWPVAIVLIVVLFVAANLEYEVRHHPEKVARLLREDRHRSRVA